MDIATLGYAVDTSQVKSATKDLNDHAAAADKAASSAQNFGNNQQQQPGRINPATNSIRGQREELRALAEAASVTGGPLGDLINRSGLLYIGALRLSPVMIGSAVAIGAVTAAVVKSVASYSDFEQWQARSANALQATNSASAQTTTSLKALTDQLARTGTQSVPEIQDAEATLLKFSEVSGDAFGQTLVAAQNLANSGFGTLSDSVKMIGTAFRDPVAGLKAFQDAGVQIDASIVKLATDLHNSGQFAAEQQVILQALSQQTGGATAKSADTLSAAWGRLSTSFGDSMTDIGRLISNLFDLKGAMDSLTQTQRGNAAANDEFEKAIARAAGVPDINTPLT
ncbi:MAG: phage tail length tape measure family protein, partial [Stellaceae bacterium]